MNIEEFFLYGKVRSYFIYAKRWDGLSNSQCEILMYCRFFATSDGWVNYSQLREFTRYIIKTWMNRRFKFFIEELIEMGLIEMRERRGNQNRKMKGLRIEDSDRTGRNIQFRLTAKGMKYLADFDKLADFYLNKFVVEKQLKAAGLKAGDEEFKTLDDYDNE